MYPLYITYYMKTIPLLLLLLLLSLVSCGQQPGHDELDQHILMDFKQEMDIFKVMHLPQNVDKLSE